MTRSGHCSIYQASLVQDFFQQWYGSFFFLNSHFVSSGFLASFGNSILKITACFSMGLAQPTLCFDVFGGLVLWERTLIGRKSLDFMAGFYQP